MDLQRVIDANPVCLLSEGPRERTWRILNISYQPLNRLRNWLERDLLSMAFNWVEVFDNTSLMPEEIWAHRIGLVPISADPLLMEPFQKNSPDLCSEDTCLVFELNVTNTGTEVRNVVSGDFRWVPLGDQASRFPTPPRMTYPDILLGTLLPGRTIQLRAYAVQGTGEQHAKWSSARVFYGAVPTRRPAQGQVTIEQAPLGVETGCRRCEELPLEITLQQGFSCYYFTIRLTGGLTFEQIDRQLRERFSWDGTYPLEPVRYRFER